MCKRAMVVGSLSVLGTCARRHSYKCMVGPAKIMILRVDPLSSGIAGEGKQHQRLVTKEVLTTAPVPQNHSPTPPPARVYN